MPGSVALAQQFGIDTSVLVRLTSRSPQGDYEQCERALRKLVEEEGCEVLASNQVIGEAYATLMHHYRILEQNARYELLDALTSGLVAPLNGQAVIEALSVSGGPGLFDRLIADDYSRVGMETLTLDRQMASLPAARLL